MDEKLHIHTIQSYLVFETEKFYQKIIAENGISHFFSFSCDPNEDKEIPFLADGCSNLIFEYSPKEVSSFFLGNTDFKKDIKLKKGCEYFGIRFEPGTNPFFANQEVKDLVNQTIPLNDFNILKNLTDKMSEQSTFTTRMCTFMEEYRNFLTKTDEGQKQLFLQMVKLIVRKDGIIKIKELADLSGYSNRYINLLFVTNLGCSAKQFCSTVKMHSIINEMNRKKIDSLVNLANIFQFYDQSHFVHAFKEFTGVTPSEYISTIKNQQYTSKVLNLGQDF